MIKKTIYILLVLVLTTSTILAQEKELIEFISLSFKNKISEKLSNYSLGSGVSFLSVEVKKDFVQINNIVSSNMGTRKIVDSLIKVQNLFYTNKFDKICGHYILSIIQIMYDDEKSEKVDYINWSNNNLTSIASLGREMDFTKKAIMLQPVLIFSSPSIAKTKSDTSAINNINFYARDIISNRSVLSNAQLKRCP